MIKKKGMKEPLIVSACLVGLATRYDGTDALDRELLRELKERRFIPLCPEQLGGLPTPRPKSEIEGGDGTDVVEGRKRVVDEEGGDVTENFLRGARMVLRIAELTGAGTALFKEKSPSCGVKMICRGDEVVEGCGVATALLLKNGIKVEGF